MTVLNDITKKANKEHRCCLCGEIIEKGSKYNSCDIVDNGEFWRLKSHLDCLEYSYRIKSVDGVTEEIFADEIEDARQDYGLEKDTKHNLVGMILELEKKNKPVGKINMFGKTKQLEEEKQ